MNSDLVIILLSMFILVLLIIIIYFLIKRFCIDIDTEAQKAYLLNVHGFEEIQNNQISKTVATPKTKMEEANTSNENIIITNEIDYKSEGILKKAKAIEEQFAIDTPKIINNFLQTKTENENVPLFEELNNVYQSLKTLDNEKLVKPIATTVALNKLPKSVKEILTIKYSTDQEICILKILEQLEEEIKKNDPTIYIVVGNKESNYNYLDKRIVTKYDKKIYKGLKIYYHNKMYDYSLE
ncbi:MAG: hypothetical protein PUD34_03785 [bacterium]|nr:hypothetical protein [bacterium]